MPKVLNIIRKLSKIPITLEILEATHIGKVIRKLSKREDVVGEKAKSVLNKWRDIFTRTEVKSLKSSNNCKKENCIKKNSSECEISSVEPLIKLKQSLSVSHEKNFKIQFDSSPKNAKGKNKDYNPIAGDSEYHVPEFPDICNEVTETNKSLSIRTQRPSLEQKSKDSESGETCAKRLKLENSNSVYTEPQKLEKNGNSAGKDKKSHKSDNTVTHKASSNKKKTNLSTAVRQNLKSVKSYSPEEFTPSEMSFEDCLTANDAVPLKRKSSSKVHPKKTSDDSASKKNSVKRNCPQHKEFTPPKSSRKENLVVNVPKPKSHVDVRNIASTLPEIQPFYRPLPRTLDFASSKKKEVLTNEEAIKFTSSRREKTNVYSGKRNHYTEFLSLQEICIRVLIENIDAIECVGETPYFLFKPVLERCTPTQLFTIENFNPHFLEDTNELWEAHCKRDYKLLSPLEHESWRDLYLRGHDEREKKFKNITANISASISKSKPVRQVKFVDVKPPRDVARKQAKNGTAIPISYPIKTAPTVKASPRPTAPASNVVTSNSASCSSNTSIPASSSFVVYRKPKVAPLMAKTLKSMKQCFRRK